MKILVTGATGFIGNKVVKELLKNGHSVIATSTNIKKAKQMSWFNEVTFIQHDISQRKDNLFEFFSEPDQLIHLAWSGVADCRALSHFEINLPIHYEFIKNLVVNGLSDITVAGTCFEYGMIEGRLNEDMLTNPSNPYGLAKDNLRKFIDELNKKYSFNCKWVRLFYMYGDGQSPKSLIPQLQEALDNGLSTFNMSKGDQLRDYLPVEEVARNICKIAGQSKITGIINCCSGDPILLKDLVFDYLKKVNRSISLNLGYYPYSDLEPFAFWGDTTKLSKIINS